MSEAKTTLANTLLGLRSGSYKQNLAVGASIADFFVRASGNCMTVMGGTGVLVKH